VVKVSPHDIYKENIIILSILQILLSCPSKRSTLSDQCRIFLLYLHFLNKILQLAANITVMPVLERFYV
jgi:hypothetical protein